MVTKEDLTQLGFKQNEHYTVVNILNLDIGRNRLLSIGSVGTPNEMMFIAEIGTEDTFSDIICLHNYDYDGFLTKEKLMLILNFFNHEKK